MSASLCSEPRRNGGQEREQDEARALQVLTTQTRRETDTRALITQGRKKNKLSRTDSPVLGARRVHYINSCWVQFITTTTTNLIRIISSRPAFPDIKRLFFYCQN